MRLGYFKDDNGNNNNNNNNDYRDLSNNKLQDLPPRVFAGIHAYDYAKIGL